MALSPSLSERFHEATKYAPDRMGGHGGLDFATQPSPFKDWYQARILTLPRPGASAGHASPGPLDLPRLGRLLFHTYGVTAVSRTGGSSLFLRASPSAGGLYPSELYVALHGVPGVPDGIHAYRAREHALALCWEGNFSAELTRYALDHPAVAAARAVLVATAVFQRSAWRYHDRAYRRVLLDTGHMLGNAVLAAPPEGLHVVPVADFLDAGLDSLLLLDPAQEGTLLLGAVLEGAPPAARAAARSPVLRDVGAPEEGAWIPALHAAGRLETAEPPHPLHLPPGAEPLGPEIPLTEESLASGEPVQAAIRRRRSTRAFRPAALSLPELGRLLAFAYPTAHGAEPRAEIAPDVLETWVVVSDVTGLVPGVYRYERARHALSLLRTGDPRHALYVCCLEQELGRDCAFAVVHACDLPAAIARYGERAYRYVHLEAGLIGERLDLAALLLGRGASGIGGFFDDPLAQMLLLPEQHAIVYVTVVGVPADGRRGA